MLGTHSPGWPRRKADRMKASGRLDYDTWKAFKKAKGEEKRRLHERLLRDNEPLTIVLRAQICGRGENRPGRHQMFKREPYVETLNPEEQDAACAVGMMKALRDFNPAKRDEVRATHGLGAADDPMAGLARYAAWKIRYELQAAIEKAGCITLRRGVAPQDRPNVARMDDPEYVETALEESAAYLGGEDESLATRWQREQAEEEAPKGPKRPASAVSDFLENRCDFGRSNFAPRDAIFGAYERHAHILLHPVVSTKALEEALLQRPRVFAHRGTMPGGRVGAFFRGVAVIPLLDLSRRVNVASV